MKYLIKIETNVPGDRIRGVDKMMAAIAADYGHKPDNLCLQVTIIQVLGQGLGVDFTFAW